MKKQAFSIAGLGPALIVLFLLGTGCKEDNPATAGAEGKLQLRLADAPYPFEMLSSAVVVIDEVTVHMEAEDEDQGGFYLVDDSTRAFDLLDLQAGVTAALASGNVPAGELDQIRLHVIDADVVLADGREFDLTIPSGESSGLKIFPSPPVVVIGDLTTEILLDFDVSESFLPIPAAPVHASDIREFHFRPVIRVVNPGDTGSTEKGG